MTAVLINENITDLVCIKGIVHLSDGLLQDAVDITR